jgi:acetoin utilization protein AcuB
VYPARLDQDGSRDTVSKISIRRNRETRVKDHMTRDVITITPSESCQKALLMMQEAGINHLPVVERERLVGILTERDILRRAPEVRRTIDPGSRKRLLSLVNVGGVMTYAPATVSPRSSLKDAAAVMLQRRIGCLPVIRNGRLIGIFTTRDAIGILAGQPNATDGSVLGRAAGGDGKSNG